MRKLILHPLTILSIVVFFSACSGSPESGESEKKSTSVILPKKGCAETYAPRAKGEVSCGVAFAVAPDF